MTDLVPDNHKKYQQFIWTSALNLVFLILLTLYVRSMIQSGVAPAPNGGTTAVATLPDMMYVIAPPAFGLVGLLLAIAWKPLSRGIIVLLALHYILMMSIVLLVGYADVTLLFAQQGAGSYDIFTLAIVLAALVFLFIFNLISLKDLDLPSIFGKR
jgi:hypothetical protein